MRQNYYVHNVTTTLTTIDIAVHLILKHNPKFSIKKTDLKKLFSFATSETHFLFNGKFYDQVDGVAMGSPLAPILANLFLGFHEETLLNNFNKADISYWVTNFLVHSVTPYLL